MSDDNRDTKPCPLCGETIKAVAIKCRWCSTDLKAHYEARKAEVEELIFNGHPAIIFSVTQWLMVPVVLGVGVLAYQADVSLGDVTGGVIFGLLGLYIYYWFKSLGRAFRITTQRALRANIDETVLLVLITEQGENRNQHEEQRNIFCFPYGFACCWT